MNRLITATCPRCGAQVQPAPGSEQVTCNYCGTVSFVARPQALRAPHAAPVPVKANGVLVLLGLGVSMLTLIGVGAAVWLITKSDPPAVPTPTSAPVPIRVPEAAATRAVPRAAPVASPIKILSGTPPLVADVDGDGRDDVVVPISAAGAAGTTEHYAAFNGKNGKELSRTPAIDDRSSTLPSVIGRRLITASRSGQLTGYGLANGSQQWTTALGARVTAFCSAKNPDSLLVATDDRRTLAVDLTTGRQSETKEACSVVLARSDRGSDPRDRHDYSAPRGVESYHCGGVTVMGSDNYTVADQCLVRARVDTDRLDGLVGHRLWKSDQSWIVFGVRKPGAYVPMVGLISKGRVAWKSEIPQDNPLEAQEGSPQYVGLAGPSIVATYASEKTRHIFVTAFAIEGGARRWTTPLPDAITSLSSLVASKDRVFVQAGDQLFVIDASSGGVVASL